MPNAPLWNKDNAANRVAKVFERVAANDPPTTHVFTQTFEQDCRTACEAGLNGPLAGALITVKDLFDVKSFVTRAGTTFLGDADPADEDADPIGRLRDAGAVLLGHTNMTELAYSGLGLNPHYNTPANALDPRRIPGGSTSGGAVSVALGLADVAIGTDTGGSCRIPAAFNGIVGFKPSQSAISRKGCKPLSQTLDSVGLMAQNVAMCRAVFEVMALDANQLNKSVSNNFVVPTNFGMDDLDPYIAEAFQAAVAQLESAGHRVTFKHVAALDKITQFPAWHVTSVECRANYPQAFAHTPEAFDPRVLSRMKRAGERSAVEYRQSLNLREELIADFETEFEESTLLMPTVPTQAPFFNELKDDDAFNRSNLQALRNPSIGNATDGCSISIPFEFKGQNMGVMLTVPSKRDCALLDLAEKLEGHFS